MSIETTAELRHARGHKTRRRRPGRVFVMILMVALLGMAAVVPFAIQTRPIDLIGYVSPPSWLDPTQHLSRLTYYFHASLGTAFNAVRVPPAAAASEWFKAAYHAHSGPEIEAAGRGLAEAGQRSSPEALEAALCPSVPGPWDGPGAFGIRGRELAVLAQAGLFCGAPSMTYGELPEDVPITYSAHPPVDGLYSEKWYPNYGLTPDTVPPSVWLHNLSHGEIVLLYNCPSGCPEVLAVAKALQAEIPPGRNPNGPGARMIITAYSDMDHRIAVVAWGARLMLEQVDRDQISAFYEEHVDRGVECRDLHC